MLGLFVVFDTYDDSECNKQVWHSSQAGEHRHEFDILAVCDNMCYILTGTKRALYGYATGPYTGIHLNKQGYLYVR